MKTENDNWKVEELFKNKEGTTKQKWKKIFWRKIKTETAEFNKYCQGK